MNNAHFQVLNPLAETIREGEDVIHQIHTYGEHLENAITQERELHGRYRDALTAYEDAEVEALSEAIIMAQAKEGPLAGIAVSSKAFDIALTKLKNDLRKGYLSLQWQVADQHRRGYEMAQVELETAQIRFKAICKVADVKTQTIRASTI